MADIISLPLLLPPQADEIVELCDNCERLFKQEKSVLELKVGHTVARNPCCGH